MPEKDNYPAGHTTHFQVGGDNPNVDGGQFQTLN